MVQAMGATYPPPAPVDQRESNTPPRSDGTTAITFHLFG